MAENMELIKADKKDFDKFLSSDITWAIIIIMLCFGASWWNDEEKCGGE